MRHHEMKSFAPPKALASRPLSAVVWPTNAKGATAQQCIGANSAPQLDSALLDSEMQNFNENKTISADVLQMIPFICPPSSNSPLLQG